jgi:hypothetical protein
MAKKALLIGINRYRITGSDLRGCVNDVENVRETLIRYYGFPKSRIKTLTDTRATQQRMKSGIEKLISGAKRGDVLVLHYSGHGSNVPDRNGDEADRRDEILCPTDLDWYDPLDDDYLREVFDGLAANVNLTVIMDCCHSGTNTRAIQPPDAKQINRFLPCPWDLVAEESGRELRGNLRGGRRRKRRVRRRDVVNVNIPEVLLTGCRDYQTSADAWIRGSYNGAMSYSLVRAIRAKRGKLTYRQLHREMRKYLTREGFSQVPQLEGKNVNLDRRLLEPF